MSVVRTARRRRKQFVQGFTHLARLGRPIYVKHSKEKLDRRRMQAIATERRMKSKTK